MNNILNSDQIIAIRECGKVLSNAMKKVEKAIKPGISTLELDQIAEKSIRENGGVPSFKNYEVVGTGFYPASLCVSINSEVVHGIPTKNRFLTEGDLVSLDLGAKHKGVCTDMAATFPVGVVSEEAQKLLKITKECLDLAIKVTIVGNKIGSIGNIVMKHAQTHGFGVVRDLVGHGIGEKPHMDPAIPNYGKETDGPKIIENMALAIEPMITLGDYHVKTNPDNWTIVTADGSLAAHFEHTVIIIDGISEVVTA